MACNMRRSNMSSSTVDGAFHPVDSSEMAFRYCTMQAIREAVKQANGVVLEPIMKLEVIAPIEFQGNIVGTLN